MAETCIERRVARILAHLHCKLNYPRILVFWSRYHRYMMLAGSSLPELSIKRRHAEVSVYPAAARVTG